MLFCCMFGELEPIAAPFFSRGGVDSVIARQGVDEAAVRRFRTRDDPSTAGNNEGGTEREGGGGMVFVKGGMVQYEVYLVPGI